MTKAEARRIIDGMGLPAAQSKAAHRTISRATTSEDIDIVEVGAGDVQITRSAAQKA
jgi:hypothetical protein